MKRVTFLFFLIFYLSGWSQTQQEVAVLNRPIELLNTANEEIENGDFASAVQKLIAAARLNPQLRDIYLSLNTACQATGQTDILKSYLEKSKTYFPEDDELCYYLGNLYQNEQKYTLAIREYSRAIQYAKQNGEEFSLVYAYYQNRANCFLKIRQFAKAIPDYNYALTLNSQDGTIYANLGIAYYQTGKRTEACRDWKKAYQMGIQSVSPYLKRYCK